MDGDPRAENTSTHISGASHNERKYLELNRLKHPGATGKHAEQSRMPQPTYDAVVIGAGLSGLQAALTLHKSGLKYLVLEARDRVGGKTLTLRSSAGATKSELGAAWINDSNQGHMWKLANELGLHTEVQNTVGNVVVQDLDGSLVKFRYGEIPQVRLFLLLWQWLSAADYVQSPILIL